MTGERDIDQIEYRWHPVKDMSPVVSSMSAEVDSGDGIPDTAMGASPQRRRAVGKRVLPDLSHRAAALAWRYRDRQAADAKTAHGRPLVSRVLVGPASLLSPDVAIALCRTGLPTAAGRGLAGSPGRVLPPISADQLAAWSTSGPPSSTSRRPRERPASAVIAAALSDPDTPLAIQLRDPYIFPRPGKAQKPAALGPVADPWPLLGHRASEAGHFPPSSSRWATWTPRRCRISSSGSPRRPGATGQGAQGNPGPARRSQHADCRESLRRRASRMAGLRVPRDKRR